MTDVRKFTDVRGRSARIALPIDEFMAELEHIQADGLRTAEPGVGAGGRRHALARVPEAVLQGVLLPRRLVHVGVRVAGGERAGRRRAARWERASTSSTGSRTWPTRPGSPATATTST